MLSKHFEKNGNTIETIIHTGQHFSDNMSEIFIRELEINNISANLGVNGGGQNEMTGRIMIELERIVLRNLPNYILVYGDTNSSLAAALVARKLNIRLIHVEAGVRNGDLSMPEEVNRIIIDNISNLNFCNTKTNLNNLKKECIAKGAIKSKNYYVGDLMYDSALYFANKFKKAKVLSLGEKKVVLCTIHRPSNTDNKDRLLSIIRDLNILSAKYEIFLPIHPRTKLAISELDIDIQFNVIEPVGYFEMLSLIAKSEFVITDSGGLVREAFFLQKLSLFLLDSHVWPELEELGLSIIYNSNNGMDLLKFKNLNIDTKNFETNLFGNGDAGKKILSAVIRDFNLQVNGKN